MRILIYFGFILSSGLSHAASTETLHTTCGEHASATPWKYCVHTTPGSQNHKVLYYLHGGYGDEKEWLNANVDIREAWEQLHAEAPVVVTVSFGPKWLLVGKNPSPASGLYELFVQEIMPLIEKDMLGGQVSSRQMAGASMGGFNAAELLLKNPELFEKVVLMCPMFVNLAPDATAEEIQEFLKHSKVPKWDPAPLLNEIRQVLPDRKVWQKESPFILADKHLSPNMPKIFLSYGDDDTFIDGDLEFETIARKQNAPLSLSVIPGRHCTSDAMGIAKFLTAP